MEKLRCRLHHSYTNKNTYITHDIAVAFETLATISDPRPLRNLFMNPQQRFIASYGVTNILKILSRH